MATVLGAESSRSGTVVELRDAEDGRLLATERVAHRDLDPCRQDPASWWDSLVEAAGRLGAGAGPVLDVAALAVAGQRQALVLVDTAGAALGPASLRGDVAAAATAARLVTTHGAGRLARATGLVPRASTPLARLALALSHSPRLLDDLGGIHGAGDHLVARLTGRAATDRSGASATGWWSPADDRWHDAYLRRILGTGPTAGWGPRLPLIVAAGAPADWAGASVHELLGLRGRPLVAGGTTDLAAAAEAAALRPGETLLLAIDGAGIACRAADEAVFDESGAVDGLAGAGHSFLPTTDTVDPAGALATAAAVLGLDGPGGLAALAVDAPAPSADGPLLVPARTEPGAVEHPGFLLGIRTGTTRAHAARGALLGIAATLVLAAERLTEAGAPGAGTIVLTGPEAGLSTLAEAVADIAGRPVAVPLTPATPVLGAAVLAAAALYRRPPARVAEAWGLGARAEVGPRGDVDGPAVLERLRELRKTTKMS
ncbi:MAG: FGGY family carbohydrate kinase [Acidimicrobiales bacterium]